MRRPKVDIPDCLEYPVINQVAEGIHRPFWSVMIPTYNCAKYLERTLKSVLQQDPGPAEMQIEVVDDCSTKDDPEAVVENLAKGRVSFCRQARNVGAPASFTTCIQRSKGYWVHVLHGDDVVLPWFYAAYKRFIQEHDRLAMVCCRAVSIDENDEWMNIICAAPDWDSSGVLRNVDRVLHIDNFICAPTAVVSREAYVKAGGFLSCLAYTADWEMWMRVAGVGPVGYIHRPCLLYRIHSGSDTSRLMLTAKNVEDTVRAFEIGVRRLPPEAQEELRATALRLYSNYALGYRATLHAKRQHRAALHHACWALRLSPSTRNLLRVAKSAARYVSQQVLWSGRNGSDRS
jgi:glycosyltransferase involved in cell wall biosynthesis